MRCFESDDPHLATRRRQQRQMRNFSSASLSNLTPLGEEAAEEFADGRCERFLRLSGQ